jgi:tetratricopeptide (TPR) repeat protein
VVIEVLEEMKRVGSGEDDEGSTRWPLHTTVTALWRCGRSAAFLVRLGVLLALSAVYFGLRARLHGGSMVYKWTIMENHVHHLPTLTERALSYAQYHALYLWKLVYPADLCFDYGFACVPTVHTLADTSNWRPLVAYSVVAALIYYAVRYLRQNLLLGLALLLVPLTPALNIFVPVGALLAERLLFIPSMGFCVIVAELLTVEIRPIWKYLTSKAVSGAGVRTTQQREGKLVSRNTPTRLTLATGAAQADAVQQSLSGSPTKEKRVTFASPGRDIGKKGKTQSQAHAASATDSERSQEATKTTALATPSTAKYSGVSENNGATFTTKGGMKQESRANWWAYLLVLPVLVAYCCRVVSRNADWRDEYSLYASGLQVCPRSLKVLTNYALLAMARGQLQEGLDAALRAVEIYPEQMAALVNAGVAYQKLGRHGESVEMFQRCLKIDPAMAKAAGYMGVSYYHWAEVQSDRTAATLLRREALRSFEQAVQLGFQAPMILHLTGSTLIELNRQQESVVYYEAALQQSANYASYYQNKGVPMLLEDDINPLNTLNQLGSVHWALGHVDEAVDAFKRGLQVEPGNIPVLTNLGNIYRELGNVEEARRMMRDGIQYSGDTAPPALYNNLGLLELNTGNFTVALGLFEQALRALTHEQTVVDGGEYVGSNGASAEAVIRANIERAQAGMRD